MRTWECEFEIGLTEDQHRYLNSQFPVDDKGNVVGYKWDEENCKATFSVRMLPYLFPIFSNLNIDISSIYPILDKFRFTPPFDTSSPDFLRPEQYEVACNMTRKSGGIVQCRTGWGKGTLITYLIKHYTGTGNVLLIAPMLSVLDELKGRLKKYDVDLSRVKGVHAAGYNNSNYKDSQEEREFMAKVDLIIVDEIENVSPSMEKIFREFCPNYRLIYGFSATANKYAHMELSWEKIDLTKLHPETVSILYWFGGSLAFKESKKSLVVKKVWGYVKPEHSPGYLSDYVNFANATKNAIMNQSCLKIVDMARCQYPDNVMLIPVKTKEEGEYLYNGLSGNYKVCFWCKEYIKHNVENTPVIRTYDDLKPIIDQKMVQILVCTSVGYRGVDFQTISDVLLVIGSSNAIVNQIIGRAERFDGEIRVWLLFNRADQNVNYRSDPDKLSTPILDACNGARLKQLRTGHQVRIEDITL